MLVGVLELAVARIRDLISEPPLTLGLGADLVGFFAVGLGFLSGLLWSFSIGLTLFGLRLLLSAVGLGVGAVLGIFLAAFLPPSLRGWSGGIGVVRLPTTGLYDVIPLVESLLRFAAE